ncbi:hypothetical protein GDO81_023696 [Engystomops pustulosus]|uniref:Uncharacterized protein n=1 Tax=Engystomops pustulosus TaxID=76066 RepID=A0AAV6YKX8_ENGPU|nr:hypothetical protein GDO81_023696 [Engystomops pustulosus]
MKGQVQTNADQGHPSSIEEKNYYGKESPLTMSLRGKSCSELTVCNCPLTYKHNREAMISQPAAHTPLRLISYNLDGKYRIILHIRSYLSRGHNADRTLI